MKHNKSDSKSDFNSKIPFLNYSYDLVTGMILALAEEENLRDFGTSDN